MSMYGYDLSLYDYGFSDQAATNSFYGHLLPPMGTLVDYDDEIYARRRPPPMSKPPSERTISSPPKHRHDGTSPLPLGMDWSLPPRIWEGRNSVWPVDSHKGWSYCLTFPSWTIIPSASGSDAVFFSVQVGIQSPEGITTTRGIQRRFNEFLKLYSELKQEYPKKNLPPPPPRRLMKMRSKKLLDERMCALEGWMQKLLSDIHVSRTAPVAIFLELEAAARQACCELYPSEPAANSVPSHQSPSNSNSGSRTSLGDDTLEPDAEVLPDDLAIEQVVSTETETSTHTQRDMEELQRKCMQLEKEKQKWEAENATKVAFLHECELLRSRLQECSVNFLDEEDKLMVGTSTYDIDLLETSDSQIGRLLAEACILVETASRPTNHDENNDIPMNRDDGLRMLLGGLLIDNLKLRKQVNSIIRHTLSKPGNSL